MRRRIWVAYVVFAGMLLGAQIFWPPPVGLANNGDYSKVTGYYGLNAATGTEDEYRAFVTDYVFSPTYYWPSKIFSSEHLFVWPAVRLSQGLISRERFDIRMVGLVHWLALLLAFAGAGVVFSRLAHIRAACLAIVSLVIFTDVAYSSSLNSFYTDTATMIFALITIVAGVGTATSRDYKRAWLIALAISGILLITSKMQHSILGLPWCVFAAVNALQSSKKLRAGWIALSAAWFLTIVFMTQSSDPNYQVQPLFTTIFTKIAGPSTDPAGDLRELGLGPEYLRFRGLFAYAVGSPIGNAEWRRQFLTRTGFGKVFLFYLRHPTRAAGLVWQDLKIFGGLNPDPGLIKYQPQQVSFSAWHTWRNYLFRNFPAHILIVFAVSLGFCGACCASADMRARYPAWLCFFAVTLMALLALAIATLADAADNARHMFVFQVLTDVMLCFWCALVSGFVPPHQAAKLPPVQDANAMQRIGPQ